MLWTEIKKWAKDKGYETLKEKDGENIKYYWAKLDTPNASGVVSSVSKLAFAIFNHMTDNKWIEHQEKYKVNLQLKQISTNEY